MSRCELTSSCSLLDSEIIIAAVYWAYTIFQVLCQLTSYTLQSSPGSCNIMVPFYRPGRKWLEREHGHEPAIWTQISITPNPEFFCCSFLHAQSLSTHYSKPALIISSSTKAFLLAPTRSHGEFKLQVICILLMALIYFIYSDLCKCFLLIFPCTQVCWGQGLQLTIYFVNSDSPQGTTFQFSKYILPVFSVQIIFPPSGMWECEGEDEEQTHLFKHLLKAFIQPSLQIFILLNY